MLLSVKTCGRLFIQMLEDYARLARQELEKAEHYESENGLKVIDEDYKERLLTQIEEYSDELTELYHTLKDDVTFIQ